MPAGPAPSVGARPAWSRPIASRPTDATRDATSRLDDEALVAAVLGGDRDAFRGLVDRESETVVRACQRVLGDRGEAEDAAQEAFVTAYRSLASWRAEGPLGAWVTRIAIRIAVRRAARRREIAWLDPTTSRAGASAAAADRAVDIPSGPNDDPVLLAIRAERAATVRAAVASLAEPYRETVALRFFADQSLDDIATLTGRPLGTVKTHLHRGLARLRDRLGERGGER